MTDFRGKPLSDYTTEQLSAILNSMVEQHNSREQNRSHEKFTVDRTINGKKIKKMEFPPVNPNFLNLKIEIEKEINARTSG